MVVLCISTGNPTFEIDRWVQAAAEQWFALKYPALIVLSSTSQAAVFLPVTRDREIVSHEAA